MACSGVVGSALAFGVPNAEASLTTQSVSITKKIDKKEGKNECGVTVSVAYYNQTTEVTVEGLGISSATLGATLSITTGSNTIYVEEVTIAYGNEEFTKSTVKGTRYHGIG